MGQSTRVEFATTIEAARAADYLNRIAHGLREGRVNLVTSGRAVRLEPGEVVRLEMEAKSAPDKRTASLGIEISWTTLASKTSEGPDDVLAPAGA